MGCAHSGTTAPIEVAGPPSDRDFHRKYCLHEKLGAGAFSVVYTAVPVRGAETTQEEVAVKVVDVRAPSNRDSGFVEAGSDPIQTNRARKEAKLLATLLGGENICRVFDCYIQGGLAYTVLEKCERTLVQAMEGLPKLNEETFRPFLVGTLKGLCWVHSKRIVHRDVKPDNFLCCGPDNTVKLCDFGLARILPAAVSVEACTGVCGTAPFMAPEMITQRPYDEKVDMWSLGVMVYSFVFGCFPYAPSTWSERNIKEVIAKGSPAPAFRPAVPKKENISPDMFGLLCAFMSRQAPFRISAPNALAHEFFQQPSLPQADLHPMLESARRFRVFQSEGPQQAAASDVDVQLRQLQEERGLRKRGSRWTRLVGRAARSRRRSV